MRAYGIFALGSCKSVIRTWQLLAAFREALEVQTVALRRQALAREQRIAAELTAQATALQVI